MTKKARVRFTVIADGIETDLFSVIDRGKVGVVILSRTPEMFIDGDRTSQFVEQHYSVHNTKDVATTITQSTETKDGNLLKIATYIEDTSDYLLWPIFARRFGNTNSSKLVSTPRSKDTVHVVGRYKTDAHSLYYTVFVCDRDYNYSNETDYRTSVLSAVVGRYRILVISTYATMPSLWYGWVAGFTTSSPVLNGAFGSDHIRIKRTSLPKDSLYAPFWLLINIIHNITFDQLKVRFKDDAEVLLSLDKAYDSFTSDT